MSRSPIPSILRQLIESSNNPQGDASAPAAAPSPGEPGGPSIEPKPGTPAPTPRDDARETAPRLRTGLAGYLRILAENAPVAMAIFDRGMKYLYANQRWLEVFRLEQTEIINRSQYDVFPSLHPGWRHVYERALAGQVVRSDRDTVDQAGQPVLYRWEVRPWRHSDTSVGGVMITCLCIGGMRSRDAAEEGAPQAPTPVSAGSQDSLWSLPLPMLALDSSGRVCRAGNLAAEIFQSAGLREGQTRFWELFAGRSPESDLQSPVMAALQAVFTGRQSSAVVQLPFATSGGSGQPPACWQLARISAGAAGLAQDCVLAIGLNLPAARPPGQPGAVPFEFDELARLQSAIRDAEDSVAVARLREARLRSVLDTIPCGVLLLDERGRVVFHNERAEALLGAPPAEEHPVDGWLAQSCRDEQHKAEVVRQWREGVWRKQLTRMVSLVAEDGLLRDLELRPASLPGGGLLVMVHDVTNDRRSEELLRATEAKFRTLVHENPLPIVLTDRSGLVFEANSAAEVMLGRTRAELRRMPVEEWFAPDSHAARGAALREIAEGSNVLANIPVELRRRDGRPVNASMRIAVVPDAQGMAAATVHFFQPVEEATVPGAAVPPDEEPTAPPVVPPGKLLLSTDAHGRVVQWSEAATLRFGLTHDEAMGRGLHTFFRPSDASGFYAGLAPLNEGGESQSVEWKFFHPEQGRMKAGFVLIPQEPGTLSVALMSENPVPVEKNTGPTGSAPKSAGPPAAPQAPGPAIAAERERMLLGEAHHRVKNHLQIVTSMLNLQLSTMNHDDAKEALRSSQNRVRSIAALHQHLYALAMGEAGDFADFVSGLIAHLRECYDVGEDRVKVELQVPEQPVSEECLMPLALSLNEMISNAFKHAYAGDRGGTMKVGLRLEDGSGDLTVEDDGAGLPVDFDDHRTAGLGLKIMRVFAGQLGGDVRVKSDPGIGTSFHLRFPLAPVVE